MMCYVKFSSNLYELMAIVQSFFNFLMSASMENQHFTIIQNYIAKSKLTRIM